MTIVLNAPLNAPVEDVIALISFTDREVAEELPQVRVVGLVVEPQGPSVVQEDGELVGEAAAENIGRRRHRLLGNRG